MSEPLRICVGAVFVATGMVGIGSGVRRRSLLTALFNGGYVAVGIGLLMGLYGLDAALGAVAVLIAAMMLVKNTRARSATATLAAIAVAVAGAGVLAGLLTVSEVGLAFMLVFATWGLIPAVRARAVGGMLFYGGTALMALGNMLVLSTFRVEFIIVSMAGFLAFIVGIFLDGWRFPMLQEQPSPSGQAEHRPQAQPRRRRRR